MEGTKNIIFDLGGVLLNIDYQKTAAAFTGLGVPEFDTLYSQVNADRLFESLETGSISEEKFYQSMQGHCAENTRIHQMEDAWNAILLDFRKDSLDTLEKLKGKYRLYLLSNTNSIHLTRFNKILEAETGKKSLDEYFTKSYYSHLIGMRKPYPDTYRWVLNDGNMVAEETLFIDDSIKNIEGAAEAGLKTHLLLAGEKLSELLL